MKTPVKIGIIGVGRFGKNYLRTFSGLGNASIRWICSTKEATIKEALSKVKVKAPVKVTTNYRDVLEDKDVDAVAIVTPASTHYPIAKEALESGKHIIVEKPFVLSSRDADRLIRIADERKRVLMAGHLHLYSPPIRRLKADIKNGLFGKINYIDISHFGNGPVRSDIGVVWDFFPHSISILLYLLEECPVEVSVNGASFIREGIEDVAVMSLRFPNNVFAASTGSWLHPLKKMEATIVGEKMYATFDDYALGDKLKYYDSRLRIVRGRTVIEDKGCDVQKVSDAKPLTEQLKHFLHCIENNKKPLTGGNEALKVVRILECAQQSLRKSGRAVRIPQ